MKLSVIGFGPGGYPYMTIEAKQTLEQAELIIGYTVYIDLLRPHFIDKNFYSTAMKKEKERCRYAIEQTLKGKNVAFVCSGDSGVYGMASLIYELSEEYPPFEIHIVSGVTAALSGGAVLGAPLTHDFSVISLSDLMTPWETIEKRIRCAALSDMCICLYNPSSKKRQNYLYKACEIILESKHPDTVCGFVQYIGRNGQKSHLLTLANLQHTQTNMFTTVFIGNSETRIINGKMVTPRGYQLK